MDEKLVITTPEYVEFSYDIAGIGSRFTALLFDTLILLTIFIFIWFTSILVSVSIVASNIDAATDPVASQEIFNKAIAVATGLSLSLNLFVMIFYYIVCEMLWNGRSPGKRWLQLRVIKENGQPIDFTASLVRNLLRLIDILLGVGPIVMFASEQSKRVGDYAAGTIVVRERPRLTLANLNTDSPDKRGYPGAGQMNAGPGMSALPGYSPEGGGEQYPVFVGTPQKKPLISSFPNIDRLSKTDYNLARETILRLPSLPLEQQRSLAAQIGRQIREHIDYQRAVPDYWRFLYDLVNAYDELQ